MRRKEPSARIDVFRSVKGKTLLPLVALIALLVFSSSALAIEAHVFSFRLGLDVNETKVTEKAEGKPITEAEENLCTAASGDVCTVGQEGEDGPGQFAEPQGVAINEESGDVYVLDRENSRVQEFTAAGTFVLMFGVGVNATRGTDVCTEAEIVTEDVECRVGSRGSAPGAFSDPKGIAIDNATDSHKGDVFVADEANHRVEVFTAAGAFVEEITGGETPSGDLGHLTAVTVSPVTGSVYVADASSELVEAFSYNSTDGRYEYVSGSVIQTAQTEFAESLAIDGAGNLYVQNRYDKNIAELNSAGVFQHSLSASGALGVAVNTTSDNVYVSPYSEGSIAEYEPSGAPILEFGASMITGRENFLAVNSKEDDVYVVEHANQDVTVFTPSSEVPDVTTGRATNVSETSATLNGSLEPFGFPSTYYFEYGTTESYGSVAPATPATAGTTGEAVSEEISGLAPNTKYYYRLVGEAGFGAKFGAKASFTTLGHAPTVTTNNATGVTQIFATLAGEVNPEGALTTFSFSYVKAVECIGGLANFGGAGCTTAAVPNSFGTAGEGTASIQVTASLSALEPNTTYYYNLTANNGRSVTGLAHELTTLPLAPSVTTRGAGEVDETSALIYGSVNSLGADTNYHFEYGPTTSYGSESPESSAGSSSGLQGVSFEATGLQPGTTYDYRIVASTTGGTTYGENKTFTTTIPEPYPLAPTVITGGATNVLASSATLTGAVNPGGDATDYHFEYGTTVYYGATAPLAGASAGSGAGSRGVSEMLIGLQPGTTYHYRLVASNTGGTAYGDDEIFTTPPALATLMVTSETTTPTKAPSAVAKKQIPRKAEKLKSALAKCHKLKSGKRKSCEKTAREKYAPKPKSKIKKRTAKTKKANRRSN